MIGDSCEYHLGHTPPSRETRDPVHLLYHQRDPVHLLYHQRDPVHLLYHQRDPVHLLYHQRDPVHLLYHQRDPVHLLYHQRNPVHLLYHQHLHPTEDKVQDDVDLPLKQAEHTVCRHVCTCMFVPYRYAPTSTSSVASFPRPARPACYFRLHERTQSVWYVSSHV